MHTGQEFRPNYYISLRVKIVLQWPSVKERAVLWLYL
uniref:Uncharacterized protein n=1 Tax=Anguilla anguilla TaxID=7936 RepID=A0A0E9WUD5_ANGAN